MPSLTHIMDRMTANASKTAIIVEFIGTFLSVLTIPLSTQNNEEVSPISIGSMLMAMGFCFGYLSGSHFNPAITIGYYVAGVNKQFGFGRALVYVIVQCAGAIAACFYMVLIHGVEFPTPHPAFDWTIIQLFMKELIFTFAIVSSVIHVSCSKQRSTAAYGFSLGMPMVAALLCVGGIRGGAFNPAAATGLLVVRCATLYCYPLLRIWLYWGAEVLAALLAAVLFRATADASSGPIQHQSPEATYGAHGIATS